MTAIVSRRWAAVLLLSHDRVRAGVVVRWFSYPEGKTASSRLAHLFAPLFDTSRSIVPKTLFDKIRANGQRKRERESESEICHQAANS